MPATAAYRLDDGAVVHRRCLGGYKRKHGTSHVISKGFDPRTVYSGPCLEAVLHPGHPKLPCNCRHCGKTIAKGEEALATAPVAQ